jgi:hypothetical protein
VVDIDSTIDISAKMFGKSQRSIGGMISLNCHSNAGTNKNY